MNRKRPIKNSFWIQGASEESSAPPLYFKNISGIFGVTVGGTILAMILVVIEMVMDVHTRAKEERLSFCGELWRELVFFMKFKEMVKPVKRRASLCRISINVVEENGKTKEGSHHWSLFMVRNRYPLKTNRVILHGMCKYGRIDAFSFASLFQCQHDTDFICSTIQCYEKNFKWYLFTLSVIINKTDS